ncbi:MAG: helix-turn-helix domain-containing protein [Chloroflexi bacterium]|nr:helix-turn-helix domain-containing protein [Chloroflexota bacterium]
MNAFPRPFDQWVRQKRKGLGLTQIELARQAHCSVSTIRKIEKGLRRPSIQIAKLLANGLKLSLRERDLFLQLVINEPEQTPVIEEPKRASSLVLPRAATELIGRNTDVVAVCAMLERPAVRLVTLLGPPGVGKTRLALQVLASLAHRRESNIADKVGYVSLVSVHDPNLVGHTIISAIGAKLLANQTSAQCLLAFLKHKSFLLVLDNFEHVLPAAALLAELLANAPRLKILVTSRAALHLSSEHGYAVTPLSLPDLKNLPMLTELAKTPAVALFVMRVQAVKANFTLTADNAKAVAELCVQLDGLPLAIELAAARGRLLSPELMLQRMTTSPGEGKTQNQPAYFGAGRLALLTKGARDLAERHQTLAGTIDWSYNLLAPAEQELFARLSIFVGGCTLDAAEAVCGACLDDLETLLSQSLLQAESEIDPKTQQTRIRFTMLETIREYGITRLVALNQFSTLQRKHAEYYLQMAQQMDWRRHPTEATRVPLRRDIQRDYTNVHAALTWSQSSQGDQTIALALAGALSQFWFSLGLHSEAQRWLQGVLEKIETDDDANISMLSKTTRAARVMVLGGAVNLAMSPVESKKIHALLEQQLRLERDYGDPAILWHLLLSLSILLTKLGQYAEAALLEPEILKLVYALGDARRLGPTWLHISHLALLRGEQEKASQACTESLVHLRITQDIFTTSIALQSQARILYRQGNYPKAESLYREALLLSQTTGEPSGTAYSLHGLAYLAGIQGHYERAAKLFGAAEALYEAYGIAMYLADRMDYAPIRQLVQETLGEAAFKVAWTAGRELPLAQTIEQQ